MRKRSNYDSPIPGNSKSQWEGIRSATTSGRLRLQSIVDEVFEAPTKPVKHDKTAVLMLHWEQSDMNVIPELDDLQKTLQDHYNFPVRRSSISTKGTSRPLYQFNAAISNFVSDFDGARPLYIVYYAGHGWPADGPGTLTLLGSTDQETLKKPAANTVAWNSVEKGLKDVDSADILVVFDCCHAGSLNEDHRAPFRFEFLGACGNGEITPKPGETSFTSAMIWALRDLKEEKAGFHSVDLKRKIKEYKGLTCNPVLFPRYQQQTAVPVWIEPMSTLEGPQTKRSRTKQIVDDEANTTVDWFDFRFHFNRGQKEKDVEELVKSFNAHATDRGLIRITVQDRSLDPSNVKPQAFSWLHKTRKHLSSPLLPRPHFNELSLPDLSPRPLVDAATGSEGETGPQVASALQLPSPRLPTPQSGKEDLLSQDATEYHTGHRRQSGSDPVEGQSSMIQNPPQSTRNPRKRKRALLREASSTTDNC